MLDLYITSLMSLYLNEVVRSAGICNVRPLYHKLDVVVPEFRPLYHKLDVVVPEGGSFCWHM